MTLNGAIKQLHDLGCAEDMPIYYKPIFAGVIDVLRRDVQEIKHGYWNHVYDDELVSGTCSVCGWQSIIMETDVADMPYCPNCGSKMNADVADKSYSPKYSPLDEVEEGENEHIN